MRLAVTRRAGLAVRAVTVLAPTGSRWKAGNLARELDSTPGFVAQTLNPLVKAGWVRSVPGPTGGYELTAAADGLSALDVIEAVDGPTATGECVLENRPCQAADSCVLHEAWRAARAVLTRALADVPATRCPPNLLPATTSPTPGPTQEP
jgi:Rrf2 family transcriptional regulator, iron-sulfur cluster assembly transcription factor